MALVVFFVIACGGGGSDSGSDSVPPTIQYTEAVNSGDLDGDGLVDVVFCITAFQENSEGRLKVVLQRTDAPGKFRNPKTLKTREGPSSVALADFNNDGKLDVVVGYYNKDNISLWLQSEFQAGELLSTPRIDSPDETWDLAAADFNQDGIMDVAVAGSDLAVLLNDRDNPGNLYTATNLGFASIGLAAADLNADGRPDLVTTPVSSERTVRVLLQSHAPLPPGDFAVATDYQVGAEPWAVSVADVNNDGLPDIVVANEGSRNLDYSDSSVSVLLQDSGMPGSFLTVGDLPTIGRTQDVQTGDLNGDGLVDIAASNLKGSGVVSLYLQAANGGFRSPRQIKAGGDNLRLSIDDLNDDGLNDLVVATRSRGRVLFQNAAQPGAFSSPVTIMGN